MHKKEVEAEQSIVLLTQCAFYLQPVQLLPGEEIKKHPATAAFSVAAPATA